MILSAKRRAGTTHVVSVEAPTRKQRNGRNKVEAVTKSRANKMEQTKWKQQGETKRWEQPIGSDKGGNPNSISKIELPKQN